MLGVEHLDADAAAPRLVDQDPRVDVQLAEAVRPDEELLVDRVLVLHAVDRHALEAELFVQRDRFGVVVHHRQVEVAAGARVKARRERAHQRLADARTRGLRVDGERPQARTGIGIVAGGDVVHAGDRAEDRTAVGILRDEQLQRRVLLRVGEEAVAHRHHRARQIDAVHCRLVLGARRANAQPRVRRRVQRRGLQRQPERVRGVQEQLLRREADDHVRIADVQRNVAAARRFSANRFGESFRRPVGLAEDQPAPAAVDLGLVGHPLAGPLGQVAPVLQRGHPHRIHRVAVLRNLRRRHRFSLPWRRVRARAPAAKVRAARPARAWSRAAG